MYEDLINNYPDFADINLKFGKCRSFKDITDFVFVNDNPDDVIVDVVFLPGSTKWEVCERAAQVYKEERTTYISPSGKYTSKLGRFPYEKITNPKYIGEFKYDYEFCKYVLEKNEVPEFSIICETLSTNTLENAEFTKKVFADKGIKIEKAILCCQAFHARRALMTYELVFPDVEILVSPVNTQGISKDNWYQSEYGISRVMGEVAKCGTYFSQYYSDFIIKMETNNE